MADKSNNPQSPIPNPQSPINPPSPIPIPNPQSPNPNPNPNPQSPPKSIHRRQRLAVDVSGFGQSNFFFFLKIIIYIGVNFYNI